MNERERRRHRAPKRRTQRSVVGLFDRDSLLRAAEAYLRKVYAAPKPTRATVEEFAHEVGFDRSYLRRVFFEIFSKSVLAVLRDLQVEHAKHVLRRSTREITAVARSCGFGTRNTFYRAFIERVGISPTGYRRMQSTK